ncbi:PAS domain S-box-containing protein/diguanylate cyclase (GGDEF)-like protein [Halanaerobium saccharolyticum]|uniref:PAS domain S-box-containing protein/diguanylate cyclase (GGDEF)-like protein n=1 Tax=Halanaerobium saccharolyticum TaxID=43595 RepID=A0A4R7Z923_9FIRM|nr:HD domain-containing phosphohydrolase [Halanaerobium saccharolyticum]RAK09348.1 PAS domain S-box-containing protein/diguanylate cyclase (GGDEF)-like protein [Halanaerobium saccharolyticum]TDW06207.1 PAS domain S-box-containing protein/diguanylate cyclase (GGDEF)-like protein [Halanaerobium saccharolyticum]TDX61001.1 PAS domain S-box-containing protein/diguanylate cyclase (GGDEF)-like protein [Halanaerobium saccharolyticum]
MDDIIERLEMKSKEIKIPEKTTKQWQKLLELLVEKAGAKDALVTEYDKPFLKIIKVSENGKKTFSECDKLILSGHYCQAVVEDQKKLEINNAAENQIWKDAAELKLGLKSYLGYPVFWPTGEIFGSICIHDNQKREFGSAVKKQMQFTKDIIEDNLEIFYQNHLNNNLRKYYSKLIDILPVGVMIEDRQGKILKVNKAMEEITGYSREKLLKNTVFETVVPEDYQETARENIKRILNGEVMIHELPSSNSSGEERFIRLQERKITLPNNEAGIVSIQSDVTDKIKSEEKIKYASYHDSLTDLYNRSYLEKKIQNLNQELKRPVALIMADLNGLKLVNDTYGHNEGDKLLQKMAGILKESCRDNDLIARWGGDEFVILLPETDSGAVKKVVKRINKKISNTFLEFEDGGKLPLSAALGYGVKNHYFEDFFDILDEAESQMYKNKLTESRSIKSNILNTLLKTLSEKSQETSSHSNRMADLAVKLAEKIGLSQNEINQLTLIAKLHDIGKTVIPEKVLNKKGSLTETEWKEIKTHPAVGHRILNATEEFSHISEDVLSHHERWDGGGYPRGLKEEEIPLLSRIIAIVDAYDVMTTDQIYKEAISSKEALKEIKKNAGSQFDPELADIFVDLMSD